MTEFSDRIKLRRPWASTTQKTGPAGAAGQGERKPLPEPMVSGPSTGMPFVGLASCPCQGSCHPSLSPRDPFPPMSFPPRLFNSLLSQPSMLSQLASAAAAWHLLS